MPARVFRFGDFELDEALFELRREGQVVPVPRRPFDLLCRLVQRRGAVVSRTELLDVVWGGTAVTEDSLAHAVMGLRQILGDDVDEPRFVQTVRGRGYRFAMPVDVVGAAPSSEERRFVGRLDHLRAMAGMLDGLRAGRGGLLLLEGASGLGKTSLLRRFERLCVAGGVVNPVSARCPPAHVAPELWLVAQWLEGVRRGAPKLGSTVDIASSSLLSPAAFDSPAARFRLFDKVLAVFASAADRSALVLVVDDLHVADESSVAFLSLLAGRLSALPIVAVATYTATALQTDRRKAIGAIAREPRTRLAALEPFTIAEVDECILHGLGAQVPDDVRQRIVQKSGGNPMLVAEMIRQLARQGAPRDASTTGLLGGAVLREAILDHLSTLPHPVVEVLTVSSIFGVSFRLPALAAALGRPAAEALSSLDAAEGAGVLLRAAGGSYRFSMPLVRDALYRRMTASERVRLHAAAATALASLSGDSADFAAVAEVAHHFGEAALLGDVEPAVRWSLRAATLADAAGHRAAAMTAVRAGLEALKLAPCTNESASQLRSMHERFQQDEKSRGT